MTITHEFKNIEITSTSGRVSSCTIDGIKGKWIESGNRRVFRFGKKFVIKFDSLGSAITLWGKKNIEVQNQREIDNYKLVHEEDRKYFAAILRTGKVRGRLFVVQEYVETTRRAFKKEIEEFYNLKDKYRFTDVMLHSYDKKHHNIAVNSKGFKLFDLGWEEEFASAVRSIQPMLW